jgi:gamma-tubulin complex component 2
METKEMLLFLLEKASVPFFQILQGWIYQGVINDPYHEFFVEENKALSKENMNEDYNDAYWEKRYTIRPENVPAFLESSQNKILVTGKYLNVIRECGISIENTSEKLVYTANEQEYHQKIEKAYEFACSTLFKLVTEEKNLLGVLRSVKHYFLLDQGDFFVHFLDSAQEELRKPVTSISIPKLSSLLELSLRTSSADSDPYKDNLIIVMQPYKILDQLHRIIHVLENGSVSVKSVATAAPEPEKTQQKNSGLDVFCFDYRVQWPLSLFISRKALTKYQLIFRQLLLCKHIERSLNQAWILHQQTKKHPFLRGFLGTSFVFRHRVMTFVQNLQYYILFEVLEPNWHVLEQNLKKVIIFYKNLK